MSLSILQSIAMEARLAEENSVSWSSLFSVINLWHLLYNLKDVSINFIYLVQLLFKEKTTTKVTNQATTSLLPSSVDTLASLVSLASTPALETTTASVHLTFSESNRWQSNTSSPQKTTAVETKKLGTVSSLTVAPTLKLPIVNLSTGRIVHSSEVMNHTSVSLLRSNTLQLATFVPSVSSFTMQTLVQARSSFATVDDRNGIRFPMGQIKTPWGVSTSTEPATDVFGTKQTTPVMPTSSLARADLVISTSKHENSSSEGIRLKPSKASKESPSAPQTTPVERPTLQYIPATGTDNPLLGKNKNRQALLLGDLSSRTSWLLG